MVSLLDPLSSLGPHTPGYKQPEVYGSSRQLSLALAKKATMKGIPQNLSGSVINILVTGQAGYTLNLLK